MSLSWAHQLCIYFGCFAATFEGMRVFPLRDYYSDPLKSELPGPARAILPKAPSSPTQGFFLDWSRIYQGQES